MRAPTSLSLVFVLLLAGCAWVERYLPSELRDRMSLGARNEVQGALVGQAVDRLGIAVFRARLRTVRVSQNRRYKEIVRRVTDHLATAAEGGEWGESARKLAWETEVVDDPRVDAVAFPGGKILVNVGVLSFTNSDESEVAAVLGHEMTHALARHIAERVERDLESDLADPATYEHLEALSDERKASIMAAFGITHAGREVLPFTREQETKADHAGLLLMARAGYDPRAALTFWTRMQSKDTARKWPESLSLHPDYQTRLARLQDAMPEAGTLYTSITASPTIARVRKP